MRIYIDESGAITRNYNQRNQRYFVIVKVITKDCKKLHTCFKDARFNAIVDKPTLVKKLEVTNEIKGSSISEARKSKVYADLLAFHERSKDTFEVGISVIDNTKMASSFFENKARSFNYCLSTFVKRFKEISPLGNRADQLSLLIDDRNVSPKSKSSLQDYLNMQFRMIGDERLFKKEIKVSYYDSQHESLIQLADFIANTVSRALNGDSNEAKCNLDVLRPMLTNGELLSFTG